jgi:hypothetical protein
LKNAAATADAHAGRERASSTDSEHATREPVGGHSHDKPFRNGGRDQNYSPDHAQTFAYGEMISHQLYRNRLAGELAACITFGNSPYTDDDQPLRNESFDFRFSRRRI